MTRDESPKTDNDSQRVIDALSDLFDAAAPSDRVSAEAELHDAGINPSAVARRSQRIAASILSPPAALPSDLPGGRRPRRHAGDRARHASPIRVAGQRGSGRRWLPRSVAALIVGIAVGWLLAYRWMPGDHRSANRQPTASEPAGGVARGGSAGLPSDKLLSRGGAERRADPSIEPTAQPAPAAHDASRGPSVPPGAEEAATDPASPTDARATTDAEAAATGESAATAAIDLPGRFVLDSNNWQNGQNLLPTAVLDRVKRGDYWFTVQPFDPERFEDNYSSRFWQASDLNAGRYRVDPDTCTLIEPGTGKAAEDFFGYPFPEIDPAHPLAGCMIAWNIEAASAMGEGQGATFTSHGVDRTGELKRLQLSLHATSYVGRHAAAARTVSGLRSASLLTLLHASDIEPLALLTLRAHDATTPDTLWQYLSQLRRIRRLSAANRSDFFLGLDVLGDDLNCFDEKIEDFTWKLLGEQQILAPVTSPLPLAQQPTTPTRSEVAVPYAHAAYEMPGAPGVPWLIVDNLMMVPRPVWVIEVQPRSPYYLFGRLILYVDREMYRAYWKDGFKRDGGYLYNAMCPYHWSKNATGEFSAVTPSFVVGVNEQVDRGTVAGRHSTQFIERDFAEDYFTVNTMTMRRE